MTLAELENELRSVMAALVKWRISAARISGASHQGRLQIDDRVRRLEYDQAAILRQIAALKATPVAA